jgi:Ca-activated chloride channel family protein
VIILLTDGENNAGTVDPITAARAASAKGIKIYAIGVGTPEGAPVPAYGPGGDKFYLRDPMGNLVLAKVDEDTLKQVADITGGTYFRATDEHALAEIYKKIAGMEKKEIIIKRAKSYRELFPYPAGAALILLVIGGTLGAGRLRVFK